jgi:LemA protein
MNSIVPKQILTARTRFNESVKPYNTHIKTFPNSILQEWSKKSILNAVEGAENL